MAFMDTGESRTFGSDVYQHTDGLLDNPHNAWQALSTPVIDLLPGQVVCSTCNYVVWAALGYCSECAAP